jgi:hypothetical protein
MIGLWRKLIDYWRPILLDLVGMLNEFPTLCQWRKRAMVRYEFTLIL